MVTEVPPSHRGEAFGAPGIEPRWTSSQKDGVGSAYSASSLVWFTLSHGILNEIYYPTVDRPQVRDMEFLLTDGETFVHEEKRDLEWKCRPVDAHSLGYRLVGEAPGGLYRIEKSVIADPHQPTVLVHAKVVAPKKVLARLRLFVLLAPHLGVGGRGNSGRRVSVVGREVLVASKGGEWLALGASTPFLRTSCGFAGSSDGWQDLHRHKGMRYEFDSATDGNIALTGEIDIRGSSEFTLGLAFGNSQHCASTALFQSLGIPYSDHLDRFVRQWQRACPHIDSLDEAAGDEGVLYHVSHSLLRAHEDKTYAGAIVASLSIPWGQHRGDEDIGGYHLVWTRDLCNSATGLLAAGDRDTPLRALIYLATSQQEDGGFYQNFWINGEPYWRGIQLDEVAFPAILAWRLARARALKDFDPLPLVLGAARYLVMNGPATQQERWEENSGYSPSTLAAEIAALVCAADLARESGDGVTARFLLEAADHIEAHIEAWTVTTSGSLHPEVPRHFVRIAPADVSDPTHRADPDGAVLEIRNRGPEEEFRFPARDVVDAGFLELVRYGIRRGGDPLFEDSLRVVDHVLRVETPRGPAWRRYNHDGYGQAEGGGPFRGHGRGRPWPLLTGERGHYELAAGRDAAPFLRALEGFSRPSFMLPEQIWDEPDLPEKELRFGGPTGAATPLLWAHGEYVRLLRSYADGEVFDKIAPVADRYLRGKGRKDLEIWSFHRQVARCGAGSTFRVLARAPFFLVSTLDGWLSRERTPSVGTGIGIHFADLPIPRDRDATLEFTFLWPLAGREEGRSFRVEVTARP
jgi:glucoamylase